MLRGDEKRVRRGVSVCGDEDRMRRGASVCCVGMRRGCVSVLCRDEVRMCQCAVWG